MSIFFKIVKTTDTPGKFIDFSVKLAFKKVGWESLDKEIKYQTKLLYVQEEVIHFR